MSIPRPPQGNTPFHRWAQEVYKWLSSERLSSGVGYRKRPLASGGFALDLNDASPTSRGVSTGGIYRGIGHSHDTPTGFPSLTFNTYDTVSYISRGNPTTQRAIWIWAWSGPDGTEGNRGPIYNYSPSYGYLIVPTEGYWYLLSYTQLDSDSEERPNSTAVQQLYDTYPEQEP